MKTRIYVTTNNGLVRFIAAKTKLQALAYAAQGVIEVKSVTKDQLAEILQNNAKIEDATQ